MMMRKLRIQTWLLLFSVLLMSVCQNDVLTLHWPTIGAAAKAVPVNVGVVLDKESLEGKMRLSCINMALGDLYEARPEFRTRIVVHLRDSHNNDVVNAASAAVDLIKNEKVAAIIGPETSEEAEFVIKVGDRAHVPIISFSVTNPFLSPSQNPYFVRAAQVDSTQVHPLTDFIQAFGWRNVVPIYVDDDFGGGIVPFFADAMQQVGTSIPYKSVIPSSASKYQILAELYKLKSLSSRVFIVHMSASLGSQLFQLAQELGMMSQDYVWIITNAMANVMTNLSPRVKQAMQGVIGLETYVPMTKELVNFSLRWKKKFLLENPTVPDAKLNVYCLWAYDAASALARAVEGVNLTNFSFEKPDNDATLSTDVSSMGVSNIGPQLLKYILGTKFTGLAGEFALSGGDLKLRTFQLINVWRGGTKSVAYWTASSGLVQELSLANTTKNVATMVNLRKDIRWPGDPKSVPRGWVTSPNGKKLRIGVPVKNVYRQFVTVSEDVASNTTKVTGFCIDVFDAVIKKLPYHVEYDYIPYTEHEGQPTESYDKLIYQIYIKNFDAVVGDATIRANRTPYADFTLPFSESGVVMIAPVKDNNKIRAWLFVKPLTWDLWVTTFCFFLFIAFVVWLLEHRINEDFRGPPGHQAGTSLYYSFSTMVFSHSFSVFSNLTRFVVIIWVFVLLLLTQSYTASLTSLLTVEQLQPTITDIKELRNKGYSVGYQEGSFVRDLLLQMEFYQSQLKSYNTSGQLHELMTRGTAYGGIAAALDEIPYLKIFMGDYCRKYTMVEPTYKTDGFGFAFPRGSPLASDISRGVLTVKEGQEMTDFENKWLNTKNCPDSTPSFSSSSLGLDSFWGLFTIAGAAAIAALIISLVSFVKEHKSVWSDGNTSLWNRTRTLLRIYDQKNLSFHTIRKSQAVDPSLPGPSTNIPYPQSPSSYWDNSEGGFSRQDGQSTPAIGNADANTLTLQASPECGAL